MKSSQTDNALMVWMQSRGFGLSRAAHILGVSEASIHRWRTRRQTPSRRMMYQIARLTDGKVPVKSWGPPSQRTAFHRSTNAFALWMRGGDLTPTEIAAMFGVTTASLYLWARGEAPRREKIHLIAQLTEGKVPAGSWGAAKKPGGRTR